MQMQLSVWFAVFISLVLPWRPHLRSIHCHCLSNRSAKLHILLTARKHIWLLNLKRFLFEMSPKACSSSILLFLWKCIKIMYCLLYTQERLESTWDTIAVYNHDRFSSSGAQILVSHSFELVAAQTVSKLFLFFWSNILFVMQGMHCYVCIIYIYIYKYWYLLYVYTMYCYILQLLWALK